MSPPGIAVFVGDLGIDHDTTWHTATQPIRDAGHKINWIPGNHDTKGEGAFDLLWWAGKAEYFHRTIVDAGSLRLAGLGGVFRKRIWNPDTNQPSRKRQDVLQPLPNMAHWDTIFQEDVDRFRGQRADILVTHEAPPPHRFGFAAIAKLAADLRCRHIVHGHHHETTDYVTEDGIAVKGLGLAEVWAMPMLGMK